VIGIFGGTFNPIHYAHLRAALEVKELFSLKEVRFIPSATPPHRPEPTVSAAIRLHMVTLAIEGQADFVCDDRELHRHGHSYMVDTLDSLRQDFPEQALLLFIGADAFNQLEHWHEWQRLFELAHIVVMTRPNYQHQPLDDFLNARHTKNKAELSKHLAGKLYFQAITPLDISASHIRELITQHRNPRFLLPDTVLNYINQHKFYRSETLQNADKERLNYIHELDLYKYQ
jgi:nicotinate-nucleotide adenylyltransferase